MKSAIEKLAEEVLALDIKTSASNWYRDRKFSRNKEI